MTAQQPFIRVSFITLNSNRLFTAEQVADLIEQHSPHPAAPDKPRTPCEECVYQERIDKAARTATLAETERIYGLFHEVEQLHLNGMAYPDLYNEMVSRIKFIHTEPLSKDNRRQQAGDPK